MLKKRGDAAVIEATNRFDRLSVERMDELRLKPEQLKHAFENLPAAQRDALASAAERIRLYHGVGKSQPLGSMKRLMARCWGSRLRRLIARVFMSRGARRLILLLY